MTTTAARYAEAVKSMPLPKLLDQYAKAYSQLSHDDPDIRDASREMVMILQAEASRREANRG